MMNQVRSVVFLILAVFSFEGLSAVTLTLTTETNGFGGAANQGWWAPVDSSGQLRDPDSTNYFTGMGSPPDIYEHRSFFSFSIPSDIGLVESAILRIQYSDYLSPDPSELLVFSDVSTNVVELNLGDGGNSSIFDDLGTGVSYGEKLVSFGLRFEEVVEIPLNSEALRDIEEAAGNFFSIGGRVETLNPGSQVFDEALFSRSHQGVPVELVLGVVPEPSSMTLMLIGLIGIVRRRRRN